MVAPMSFYIMAAAIQYLGGNTILDYINGIFIISQWLLSTIGDTLQWMAFMILPPTARRADYPPYQWRGSCCAGEGASCEPGSAPLEPPPRDPCV